MRSAALPATYLSFTSHGCRQYLLYPSKKNEILWQQHWEVCTILPADMLGSSLPLHPAALSLPLVNPGSDIVFTLAKQE